MIELNQRILLFSASFYLEPLKVAHHEQQKNLSLSCPTQLSRNYLKIFRSHSVFFLVFSVSCCLENAITSWSLTTTNLAAKTNILHTSKPGPVSKIWKIRNCTFLNIVTRATYEKYATWIPDVVVVLILRVF